MLPSLSMEGKVALVTGGRSGIGKATALLFAEAGADVAVCSRTVEDGQLASVAEQVRKLGRRSLAMQTDVSSKSEVDSMVQRVTNELGPVDILVNNAGVAHRPSLLETEAEDWESVIDINVNGIYYCCRAVGRGMAERKRGNIINIASIQGLRAGSGKNASYDTSKAAVIMLTKVFAWELGPYNIRVNAIGPGGTKTPMTIPEWQKNPDMWKQSQARIPLGRHGEPEDMAKVALFLASDLASYVTGQTIFVDGGVTS